MQVRIGAWTILATLALATAGSAWSETINARDYGAKGDGKADDTEAVQKAIAALGDRKNAELVLPAGVYRITKTLQFVRPSNRDITFRGEGNRSILLWDGEKGGTMVRCYGLGHCHIHSLCFDGQSETRRRKDRGDRAGILMLFEGDFGAGNMINHFSFVQFVNADVGLQMGTDERNVTNADISFEHVLFTSLGSGFRSRNNQAVDFLFNYVFALECHNVFYFERGGNLCVNNCQATGCNVVLRIEGGGRCASTFALTNVRLEGNSRQDRDQLLVAKDIFWEQALVRFTGFDDCLWQWSRNKGPKRTTPMCEIGGGVNVAFESSTFNGPVAHVDGNQAKPGSLVLRECTFGYILPHQAIQAGQFGFFKTLNCMSDHGIPLPDVVKWPELKPVVLPAQKAWKPELPPVAGSVEAAEAAIEQARKEWMGEK